jgi:hypothetical protein
MTPEARFLGFVEAPAPLAATELFEFFDGLEPIEVEAMFGEWEGDVLRTGHDAERHLGKMRWIGKTFHDADDVDPIISRGERGEREVNPIMGKASLRMVRHRGVVTATMVYDKHPIFDYFRRIADDRVMGIMDRKGDAGPLFFWLRRVSKA